MDNEESNKYHDQKYGESVQGKPFIGQNTVFPLNQNKSETMINLDDKGNPVGQRMTNCDNPAQINSDFLINQNASQDIMKNDSESRLRQQMVSDSQNFGGKESALPPLKEKIDKGMFD